MIYVACDYPYYCVLLRIIAYNHLKTDARKFYKSLSSEIISIELSLLLKAYLIQIKNDGYCFT